MTFQELYNKILSLPNVDIYPAGSKVPIKSHSLAMWQNEIIRINIEQGKDLKKSKECQMAKHRLQNILKQIEDEKRI